MASALSPEKVAFLRGETAEQRPTIEEKGETPPSSQGGRERVTITVRLEPEVAAALTHASAERKVKRIEPYTQQDMIGEALKQWLHDAGFWPSR
jgi:hypothetical protein